MLNNYIIAALRAFQRQKQHVFLNLFGLSIGLAAAFLVALFVNFERSYDKFQPQNQTTYRLAQHFIPMGLTIPVSSPVLNKHINNIDGIEDVFTLGVLNSFIDDQVSVNGEYVLLDDLYSATPNIQDFFNIEVIDGDLNRALTLPDRLVLTESEARRLFGRTDVVGETLQRKEGSWTIDAVIADLPENTHLYFKALSSMSPALYDRMNLGSNAAFNYLRINDPEKVSSIANELTALFNETAYDGNEMVETSFQPLTKIHLTSQSRFELKEGGSESTVLICIGLSALLIVIVSVNFINMTIAQSSQRAKEVGVRKALGASKLQLVTQFLTESVLLTVIAALIA